MKRYIAAQAILPFIIGVFWLTPAISAMISVVDKNYAKTLVKGRISSLERVEEYPSLGRDRGKDLIVIGESSTRYGHWRILIIRIDSHVTTLWDSDRLRQDDFVSTSLSEINTYSLKDSGYVVTFRGCAPHQCSDGRMGYAVYSGEKQSVFLSHVITKDDGSYTVKYQPNSNVPSSYKRILDQMMCSDPGITNKTKLPIDCAAN